MKVIFSRKGFDNSYGGYPSIILPKENDYKMISFPIPESKIDEQTGKPIAGVSAKDINFILNDKSKVSLESLFQQLGIDEKIRVPNRKEKGLQNTLFHYDPEVQEIENMKNYGAFGQSDAAAKHLISQGVGKGDVFLFYGTFKKTVMVEGKLKYDSFMHEIHAIWGYLIVDDIIPVKELDNEEAGAKWEEKYPDIKTHLHYQNKEYEKGDNIIICGKKFGTFNFSDKHQLTKPDYSKSYWHLPECFKNKKMSYCGEVNKDGDVKSAPIGQEFVMPETPDKSKQDNPNDSKFQIDVKNWLVSLGVEF